MTHPSFDRKILHEFDISDMEGFVKGVSTAAIETKVDVSMFRKLQVIARRAPALGYYNYILPVTRKLSVCTNYSLSLATSSLLDK